MQDIRYTLLRNNQFKVSVGSLTFSFSKVMNISDSIEYETVIEGGRNESPIFLYKNKTKPEIIHFEKGIQVNGNDKDLIKLTAGAIVRVVTIMVMKNGKVYKSYSFDEGIITKCDIGNLDASGSELLIKTIEITHSGLHEKASS